MQKLIHKYVKCGTCGVEFDLLTAKPCQHGKEGFYTMECPNGHCICDHPLSDFRPANPDESSLGFAFVLKSAFPLTVESEESQKVKPT